MPHLHKQTRALPSLLVLFMLLALLLPVSAQQVPSTNDGGAVNLMFTAIDKKKHFVTTLRKEDIRVTEDGVPQEITAFGQQTDQSLSIVMILDMSISQERVIPIAKQVSLAFVNSLARSGKDSIGIISFTGEAKFEQELTGDLEQVRRAIGRLEFVPPTGYMGNGQVVDKPPILNTDKIPQGSTAIWDTISFATEKFGAQASDSPRRAIILFTDGNDTSSQNKLTKAAETAIKSGVVVYSIGIGDEYYGGVAEGPLRKISEQTGGRAFFPKIVQDVRDAFAGIEQELRSQYSFSYSPARRKTGDGLRKVKIEIINPELRKQELQLSYPQGYYTRSN